MTRTTRQVLESVVLVAGTVALAAVVLAVIVALAGFDASRALTAVARGSFGSSDAFLSATLVRATPLVLTGLAVTLAFRAGVLNIGAEGQLLVGAAAATATALAVGATWWALPTALLVAVAAGACWAGIAAFLRARYGVLDVISTLMLNFVAQSLVAWLVRGPLQEPLRIYPQSPSIPTTAHLPLVVAGARLHAGFVLALVLAGALAWGLARTAAGFRVRAAGENPFAARSAGGIAVGRVTALAFVASGALAGLAGGVEVTGVTFALYENLSPGYGFTAIAVALLARVQPVAVVATGIVFGALEAGATAMQRDAGVPSVLVSVVEALLILVLVIAEQGRTAGWFRRGAVAE
jgi:simple sugar transport system permease protein